MALPPLAPPDQVLDGQGAFVQLQMRRLQSGEIGSGVRQQVFQLRAALAIQPLAESALMAVGLHADIPPGHRRRIHKQAYLFRPDQMVHFAQGQSERETLLFQRVIGIAHHGAGRAPVHSHKTKHGRQRHGKTDKQFFADGQILPEHAAPPLHESFSPLKYVCRPESEYD